MSGTALDEALAWWASQDDFGGFRAVGALVFQGWRAGRSCRAPHREDRNPSFSIYKNAAGKWRFKDHSTGESGGLVGFVMLSGIDTRTAVIWLLLIWSGRASIPPKYLGWEPGNEPDYSSTAHDCAPPAPYSMGEEERHSCAAMAAALAGDDAVIHRFAAARHWKESTIRGLAMDCSLGVDDHRMVLIYPTGAKLRHKPLEPAHTAQWHGAKFTWMFGKPDAPWRGDRISEATARIHITEGETDAITLIDAGFDNGTTELVVAVPGASGWRDEWKEQFRGVRVVVWPDNDDAGERLTARITDSLAHVAASIGVAKFPKNPELLHLNPAT